METLRHLGEMLVEAGVIDDNQLQTVFSDADGDLEAVLAKLTQLPAWWDQDAPQAPALTAYQRRKIEQAYPLKMDHLGRMLRLKHYLILEKLGSGGMGSVFKAWDLQHQRYVAVKRVKADAPVLRRRFRREAKIMLWLKHRAIAKAYEVFQFQGWDLLVMEYLNGGSLSQELRRRPRIPWREVAAWAVELLAALEHAHQRKVIHRDIKPSNIVLHQEPSGGLVAKLVDMGLAKSAEGGEFTKSGGKTRANQLLGTHHYMPPEQWKGSASIVPNSDLYSLGGALFFALTGKTPFLSNESKPSMAALCRAHMQDEAPRVAETYPDVPGALDDLIRKMLSKDPHERGTPAQLRAVFSHLVAQGDSAASAPPSQARSSAEMASGSGAPNPAGQSASARRRAGLSQESRPKPMPNPPGSSPPDRVIPGPQPRGERELELDETPLYPSLRQLMRTLWRSFANAEPPPDPDKAVSVRAVSTRSSHNDLSLDWRRFKKALRRSSQSFRDDKRGRIIAVVGATIFAGVVLKLLKVW